MGGSRDEYIAGYRDQVTYISARIARAIGEILSRATSPPVIVLQSDHGPGSQLDWWSLPRTHVSERFGILNAILLPSAADSLTEGLADELSPVNAFRLVLNACFGADVPLLPDRSYYTALAFPYCFFDVTGPETVPAWPGALTQSPLWRQSTQ